MSNKTTKKEISPHIKREHNSVKTKHIEKKYDTPGGTIDKLIFISVVILGFATVYFIRRWTTAPPMPEYNLNEYWGTYPMDPKPDTSIKPFQIEFSDVIVNDLRERLLHRRPLPQPLENAGFTYGFNSIFLTQVVEYWANSYRFKDRERFLNQYKHYKTRINGLNVHFMHVKPQMDEGIEYNTVPIVLLHGWPGSVREFYELIPKLTKASSKNFIFEVVVPSLPGFGFSEAPTRPGFGPMEMAIVTHNLMLRLGHTAYFVQGGDLGHTVGSIMATMFPAHVLGFHTNFPAVLFNPSASLYHLIGAWFPWWIEQPELLSRLYPIGERISTVIEEMGYFHLQATKPDTIGTALSDSPAGLAAYILEKFSTWTDNTNKRAYDGNLLKKYSLTHLLDNVMIYWTSNTITTSMRIYAETVNKRQIPIIFDTIPTDVPTWGIKFRHELMHHSDRMLRLKYNNYLQSTIVDDGGHFAALENPDIMAHDIFEAVHAFKLFHARTKTSSTSNAPKSLYDFTIKNIFGTRTSLEKYRGNVLLIVNVASKCKLTEANYRELNELHDRFHSKGLSILAFPSNQFSSEPGNAKDIIKFIKHRRVQFDVFEKIDVNGPNTSPVWNYLKREVKGGNLGEDTSGNFEKFLVDRLGDPALRFGPNISPKEMEPYLIPLL